MKYLLTNQQMRDADATTIANGTPSQTLMQRAGEQIANTVFTIAQGKKVVVVCGTGNNGGDGYVCAKFLLEKGVDTHIYAIEGALSPDCLRERLSYTGEYTASLDQAEVIVDCLLGTGLCRPITGQYADVITQINNSKAIVVSADIPSGINGDNGLVMGVAVQADITVAIAQYKVGHFYNDGMDYCGKLVLADIGIPRQPDQGIELWTEEDVKTLFIPRKHNTHKGTFGTAMLVVGSSQYLGAGLMATESALRSGCGYVKLYSPEIAEKVVTALPQTIATDHVDTNATCIAIGSGCGVSPQLYQTISKIVHSYTGDLVLDADALNCLAEYGVDVLKGATCHVLLTPHVKELSRICHISVGEILSDPVPIAQNFAREYGVTLLLKGCATLVTDGKQTALVTAGNSALAKAGSGDLLTGLVCGTCASGLPLFQSAIRSSFVLGLCAELCSQTLTPYCVTARDVLSQIPQTYLKLAS